MDKDIFCLTGKRITERISLEKFYTDKVIDPLMTVIDHVKNTNESDGWHRVVFSQNTGVINSLSFDNKMLLMYYLRQHPNIISKLSDKERPNMPQNMKPRLFKYVATDYRASLGFDANYFRNIPDVFLNVVKKNTPVFNDLTTDILTVIEYLRSKKADSWTEITPVAVSAKSGAPIENVRCALNSLLEMKIIVLAHVEGEIRKSRTRLMCKFTPTKSEYNSALSGEGIQALRIIGADDILHEDFKFTVLKYYRSLIGDSPEEPDSEVQQAPLFETITADNDDNPTASETSPPSDTAVSETPAIYPINPQFEKTLDAIQQCMTAFVGIAESLHNDEIRRTETFNSILSQNDQKHQENDNLRAQIADLRKLLNKRDRDKFQFLKSVQDSLNLLIGQIVNATAKFAGTPRYNFNEQTIAEFTTNITNIVVQTEKSIQKLANIY